MITASSITLNNIVSIKEAHVTFDHPLTVITGHNKDSLISNETSNGAGKSLLLSSLANVVYDSTPLGSRKKRADMLQSKDSSIEFNFAKDSIDWGITQKPSSFVITENGNDTETRTVPLQKKKISEIFPLSEDEFYSYVYIQSQKSAMFKDAKNADRLHYISTLFGLDSYDKMKAYFTKKLGEIKDLQIESDVIANDLSRIQVMMDKRGKWTKALQKELDDAESITESLSSKLMEMQTKLANMQSFKSKQDKVAKLSSKLKKLPKVMSIKEIKAHGRIAQKLEDYNEALDSYKSKVKDLKASIKKIGEVRSIKEIKSEGKEIQSKLDKLQSTLEELKESRASYKVLHDEYTEKRKHFEEFGVDSKAVRSLDREKLREVIQECKSIIRMSDIVSDCEDGSCPTCQQSVDIDSIVNLVKKARKRLEKAKEQEASLLAYKNFEEVANRYGKVTHIDEDEYKKLKCKFNKLSEKEELLLDEMQKAERLKALKERLSDIDKPEKPEGITEFTVDQLEEQLEVAEERKELQSRIDFLISEMNEYDIDVGSDIDSEIKSFTKKYKKSQGKYADAQKTINKLTVHKKEIKLLKSQAREKEERLSSMSHLIEKRDVYKALEKAYSAKGLKVDAANQILALIQEGLNNNASLIFAEPFRFEVFADKDGVHCIVDRGNGTKKSDIRFLSGAESDAFRLLWVWVLLTLIGDDRRTNFIILDEADSHMDNSTRELFATRFIPALRTLVPCIFVITPLDPHIYSDCKYLTVVKEGGISTVEAA